MSWNEDDARRKTEAERPWPIDCITADPIHASPIVSHASPSRVEGAVSDDTPLSDMGQTASLSLRGASLREIYAEILRRVDEDPTRDGPAADTGADGEVDGISDARLQPRRSTMPWVTRCSTWTTTRW